ncbi:MAG TPA: thiol peroxidase [Cyclobacteriaceae bacterium]
MAQTKLGENTVNTIGDLPAAGSTAPDFTLVDNGLKNVSLSDFKGKKVVLNIHPSIDTGICATSVREFNKRAAALDNTVILSISRDLPFAFKRFCGAEGIDKVITLSDFRNKGFAKAYGVEMIDGGMSGLLARSVVVIDETGKVKHSQIVPVVGQEPDYDAALASL